MAWLFEKFMLVLSTVLFSGWKEITSGSHHIRMMDGGHFYLKEPKNTDMIVHHITDCLLKL